MTVDRRAEFEPFIVEPEQRTRKGGYVAYCPAHEDPEVSEKPSADLNFDAADGRGVWYCYVCAPSGKLATMGALSKLLRERKAGGWSPGAQRPQKLPTGRTGATETLARPLPDLDVLESWTELLLSKPELLAELEQRRGLTADSVQRFGIGWIPGWNRFSIPVFSPTGELLNLRCYTLDGEQAKKYGKMIWYVKGDGERSQTLFGYDGEVREASEVVVFEGELDCLLAKQDGVRAVAYTSGAKGWRSEWSSLLQGKDVRICLDNDAAGREGAEKLSRALAGVAAEVTIVELPVGEKEDYTDLRAKHRQPREVLDVAIAASRLVEVQPPAEEQEDESAGWDGSFTTTSSSPPAGRQLTEEELPKVGELVTVQQSQDARGGRRALELEVLVVGKTEPAYVLPSRVRLSCSQDKGKVCQKCPMGEEGPLDGEAMIELRPDDEALAEMIDAPTAIRDRALLGKVGARCADRVAAEVLESFNVEHLMVTDSLDRQRELNGSVLARDVYSVGTFETRANENYRIVGQQIPDPKSQRGLFTSWLNEPVSSSLDEFEMTPELRDELTIFQTAEQQSPLDKCREIAADLSANVTNIYGRENLHLAYDMVFHSVLSFDAFGKHEPKGWLEMMVMGDSRTGKSEAANQLIRHYSAGTLQGCDRATLAGLVGGVSTPTAKGRFQVTWGVVPQNDRRLVVLDESQSLIGKGIIESMSSIRSAGKAEIAMIAQAETTARTRLIWIANPPSGRQVTAHARGGMDAIGEMFPAHEDVARFDFAMAAAEKDVDADLINSIDHTKVKHVYTSGLCSQLVTWAWSRKASDIHFEQGVEVYALELARKFGSRFSADFPLVQSANVRLKLLRMATAIAARTFSTDESGQSVVVGPQHVRDAARFIISLYSNSNFGYGSFSDSLRSSSEQADKNVGLVTEVLRGVKNVPEVVDGRRVARGLLAISSGFEAYALADAGGMQVEHARQAINWLEGTRYLRRGKGGRLLDFTPQLIEVLKVIREEEMADV